jgi:hypothetical protein
MIVIFASRDDDHAVTVGRILESGHDETAVIFDMSSFPTSTRLIESVANGDFRCELIDGENRRIDLAGAKSFWWRRPQAISVDARIVDANLRNFALNESISAFYGVLRCCSGLWVNDIHNDANADYKPRQLDVARRVGFTVPETLVTNDPEEVLRFWEHHGGAVVYKAFNQRGLIWRPTRRLTRDDLHFADYIRFAPVIFQRLVEGNRDVRVTVVGDEVFATEFVIEDPNCVDYRLYLNTAPCRAHALPGAVGDQLHALMCELGLEYGGVDFRITPGGEYVFFEINTAGEFLYVERRTGQPIARAMAAHLARGERRNRPAHGDN